MERVEAMGGSFDVNLTMSTTHLLAASSNTEKYRVATSMKARSITCNDYNTVVVQYVGIHPCDKTLTPAYRACGRAVRVGNQPLRRGGAIRLA